MHNTEGHWSLTFSVLLQILASFTSVIGDRAAETRAHYTILGLGNVDSTGWLRVGTRIFCCCQYCILVCTLDTVLLITNTGTVLISFTVNLPVNRDHWRLLCQGHEWWPTSLHQGQHFWLSQHQGHASPRSERWSGPFCAWLHGQAHSCLGKTHR